MVTDKRNSEDTDCGVKPDEFPHIGKCCRENVNPSVTSYEKICSWCSIWTSLPDSASLKTATIFECDRLGYGKRVKEQQEQRQIAQFENHKSWHEIRPKNKKKEIKKMEKMKELYEKVAGDSALQTKFAEIMKEAEEARAATQEKLIAFAKEAGYEVSFEEVQEYFKALSEQNDGALSDAELDAVAGGKSTQGVGMVLASVFSFGLACAVYSFGAEQNKHGGCAESFQ